MSVTSLICNFLLSQLHPSTMTPWESFYFFLTRAQCLFEVARRHISTKCNKIQRVLRDDGSLMWPWLRLMLNIWSKSLAICDSKWNQLAIIFLSPKMITKLNIHVLHVGLHHSHKHCGNRSSANIYKSMREQVKK